MQKIENKETIGELLKSNKELLRILALNFNDGREIKKFNEVVGFCEQIVQIVGSYPLDREVVFLDCSCGKSYLSFALNYVLSNLFAIKTYFYGVDTNKILIEKCDQIKEMLGYGNMRFTNARIIDVEPEKPIDIVIALHACDVATDETIAKGIKLSAKYIIVVPCCENQIRSRLKVGHPLVDLTDFGLLRYRFADILTEALRAQFLSGAGYYVKLVEVISPKFTPKNLMIIARRKRGNKKYNLDKYKKLDEMFNTEFALKNYFNADDDLTRNECLRLTHC
ncbi:MAG: SAM-dependent methyltransferase [Planctomycetota bacterium]|nr:SAM-dependent methyltransferase [Planctomycetota bacterium]MDE2216481.1 SAM-dependent methyltransferase [Planctomycetota bacterium]